MSKNPDTDTKKFALKTYSARRKFNSTPEPPAGEAASSAEYSSEKIPAIKRDNRARRIFVIHKHFASHLHWDLRIEKDGVLKSWAIPKEPPTEEGTKRLAIRVEDHPLEYARFEGVIPTGNYGAGEVDIWDNGYCKIEQDEPRKMTIEFSGKLIKGKYALINISGKNWIFFKTKNQ